MSSINQPFTITLGGNTYSVPAPKARVGKRATVILDAARREVATGEEVDPDKVLRDLGIDDPDSYDIGADLLGVELNERMLDELTFDEYNIAQRAVFIWITPGAGREAAEAYLADPTGEAAAGKQPQDHKPKAAPRKAAPRKTTPRKQAPKASS